MGRGVTTPTVVLVAEECTVIPAAELVAEQRAAPAATLHIFCIACCWTGWCKQMEKISETGTPWHYSTVAVLIATIIQICLTHDNGPYATR